MKQTQINRNPSNTRHGNPIRAVAIGRANRAGLAVDTLLSIGKVVSGLLFHSQALIVDGVHSFSDLVTDAFVIWITRLSHAEPDADHPYGHARFETAGTVIFGVFLMALAGALAMDALERILRENQQLVPEWPALVVAVVAVIIKDALYRYTRKIALRWESPLLLANAWHHRSDVLSTVVVIIGIAGALGGAPALDGVAAVIVAVLIAWVGGGLIWNSIRELVDTAPLADTKTDEKLRQTISSVNGVSGIHALRSRKMGPDVLLDVHIQVPSNISVSEGHQIGDWVVAAIREQFGHVTEVIVHIDAEDDVEGNKENLLPLRDEVVAQLKQRWREIEAGQHILGIYLHYLGGKIILDVVFQLEDYTDAIHASDQLQQALTEACADLEWIGDVRLIFVSAREAVKLADAVRL